MLIIAFLLVCSAAFAQLPGGNQTRNSLLDTIPEDAKAVFYKYVQQNDAATVAFVNKHRRDNMLKRFSIHTNVVDWVTLVPNIGIEFDLKGTPRNNYSVSLFGKFNGNSRHGSLVYNVNAVRVEVRKYWRTGKYGKQRAYHEDFEKLYTVTNSIYYNADSLAGYSYYVDTLGRAAKAVGVSMESIRATSDMTQEQKDALDFADDSLGIKKHRFRSWYYNTYNKVRRNVTSGRTLENPRNWRAYYLGVWVGMDNWSISLTGKGKQGNGIGAGIVGGYTLPLLPQKFPREGSLDLDLGIAVGWKAVKYDAYVYESSTLHYVLDPANSRRTWGVVPYPIVQDLHVSLVWRFRGIKSKVDKSLIDDYEKRVSRFNERKNAEETKYINIQQRRKEILEQIKARSVVMADSAAAWDEFNRRREEAARRINPDTVFSTNGAVHPVKQEKGVKSSEWQRPKLKIQNVPARRKFKAAKAVAPRASRRASEAGGESRRTNAGKQKNVPVVKDSVAQDTIVLPEQIRQSSDDDEDVPVITPSVNSSSNIWNSKL